ncbi:VWA domain-containing protein [Pirellulaceae bacterium SH501]
MEWRNPIYFMAGLCAVSVWIAIVWWGVYRSERMRERFAPGPMRSQLLSPSRSWTAWASGSVHAAAILLAFASLAGPQFGEAEQIVESRGNDIYVLLDVSRSMMATDVLPSRLDRAKADISSLVNRLKGERVGLIVFAGQAVIQCPLTVDYENYKRILASVDTFSAPRGGTAIGDAIRKSVEILSQTPTQKRSILLVSDGGDLESSPVEAAELAAEKNIPIYTIGLGDSVQGARIPAGEMGGFVEFNGEQVWSKLEPALLEDIARRSSGQFFEAGTRSMDMTALHTEYLQAAGPGSAETQSEVVKAEQYQWFLGVSLGLILLTKIRWPYRKRSLLDQSPLASAIRTTSVLVIVMSHLFLPAVYAAEERTAFDPSEAFRRAYSEHINGNSEEAIDWYEQASRSADPKLVSAAQFNLGKLYLDQIPSEVFTSVENVPAEDRSRVETLAALAIDSFANSLELRPDKQDAKEALEASKQWIAAAKRDWRLQDLRAKVEKSGGLKALQDLASSQFGLLQETQEPGVAVSPVRLGELAQRESKLLEELEIIRLQIRKELANAGAPDTGSPTSNQDDDSQVIDRIVAECKSAMERGRIQLNEFALQEAANELTSALQSIENTWNLLAPYEAVLDRAVREQEELVKQFDSSDPVADDKSNNSWSQREAWNRKRASLLAEKAAQTLAMQSPPEKEQGADSVKGYLEKAIEIGPRAADAMRSALNHALAKDSAATKGKADEALQLLRELIPPQDSTDKNSSDKENPPKNEDAKNEEEQDGKSKEEQKGAPNQDEKSNKENQGEDAKEPDPNKESDDGAKEDRKPEEEKKSIGEEGKNAEPKESSSQADSSTGGEKVLISPERLEELLRKVREREVEKRIRDKRWRERNYGRRPVEKDW